MPRQGHRPAFRAALVGLAFAALAQGPAQAAASLSPAAERGRAFAEARCAMCHAIGRSRHGRDGMAPSFRALARRETPLSLERRLRQIGRTHDLEMRVQPVSEADVRDLAAYIETLGRR